MPTRKDVPLLAHAREVDINDTELMMGDDDGFLAVVIANRLPLAGVGHPMAPRCPSTYHACLMSLENQFDRLHAGVPATRTLWSPTCSSWPRTLYAVSKAVYDHDVMQQEVDAVVNPSIGALEGVVVGPHDDSGRPMGDSPHADSPGMTRQRCRSTAGAMTVTAYRTGRRRRRWQGRSPRRSNGAGRRSSAR
jgi:hypothetical protein